ncbi:hypothetical protein EIP91_010938, partial [Steccherinum ochraceum]
VDIPSSSYSPSFAGVRPYSLSPSASCLPSADPRNPSPPQAYVAYVANAVFIFDIADGHDRYLGSDSFGHMKIFSSHS